MTQTLRQARSQLTVAEFIDWDPGNRPDATWQLVDGEPVAMAPASQTHGAIQGELASLIRNHLRATGSPCRVIVTPGVIPKVRASENFRIPDLGVTCTPPTKSLEMPDPVLLIEIMSPSNQPETRANIWSYTTIPSVQEILVVHSTRIAAELLRRGPDGSWPANPDIIDEAAGLTLTSIHFAVPLAEFYVTTELHAQR